MPTARSPAAATYPLPRLLRKSARTGSIIGASGGGATLSGGEPLLQAEGAALLAKSLRSEGTEVLIDTAGCVPFSAFEKVMPYTNGFLFDVKACTEEDYARIGGEFFLVRDNFGKLTKAGANVRAREPLMEFQRRQGVLRKNVRFSTFAGRGKGRFAALSPHGQRQVCGAREKTYAYRETPPMSFAAGEEIAAIYKKYFTGKNRKVKEKKSMKSESGCIYGGERAP